MKVASVEKVIWDACRRFAIATKTIKSDEPLHIESGIANKQRHDGDSQGPRSTCNDDNWQEGTNPEIEVMNTPARYNSS